MKTYAIISGEDWKKLQLSLESDNTMTLYTIQSTSAEMAVLDTYKSPEYKTGHIPRSFQCVEISREFYAQCCRDGKEEIGA